MATTCPSPELVTSVLKCHLSCFEVEGDTLRVLVGPFQSKLSSMEGVTPFAKAGLSFMAYETLKAHLVADEADVDGASALVPWQQKFKGRCYLSHTHTHANTHTHTHVVFFFLVEAFQHHRGDLKSSMDGTMEVTSQEAEAEGLPWFAHVDDRLIPNLVCK